MGALGPILLPVMGFMLIIYIANTFDLCMWMYSKRPGSLRRAWSRLLRTWQRSDMDPEVERLAGKLSSARRVELGRKVLAAGRVVGSVFWLQYTEEILKQAVTYEVRVLTSAIGLALVSMVMRFKMACLGEATLALVHLSMVALFMISLVADDDAAKTQIDFAMDVLFMMVLCGFYLCLRLLVFTNVCMSVCSFASFLRSANAALETNVRERVSVEIFSLMLRLLMIYSFEWYLEHVARMEIVSQLGKCHQSAVSSLLDIMCDAVVELDEGLRLKDHFPKLANMLMHGSGKRLLGTPIADYIAQPEDQDKFKDSVGQALDEGGCGAGMLTTRLRDSMGNFVKVIFYYVHFLSVAGETCHLIGIREDGDAEEPDGLRAGSGAIMPEAQLLPAIVDQLRATPTRRRSSVGSANSGRSRASSRASSRRSRDSGAYDILGPEENDDMSLEIQAHGALAVTKMGKALRSRLGINDVEECDLGELLHDGGVRLREWLSNTADQAMEGNYGVGFTERLGEIALESKRASAQAPLKMKASARFLWPPKVDGHVQDVVLILQSERESAATSVRGTAAGSIKQSLEAPTVSIRGSIAHL